MPSLFCLSLPQCNGSHWENTLVGTVKCKWELSIWGSLCPRGGHFEWACPTSSLGTSPAGMHGGRTPTKEGRAGGGNGECDWAGLNFNSDWEGTSLTHFLPSCKQESPETNKIKLSQSPGTRESWCDLGRHMQRRWMHSRAGVKKHRRELGKRKRIH